MRRPSRLWLAPVLFLAAVSCGTTRAQRPAAPVCTTEPPAWLYELRGGACALGMAGRAPDPDSERPLELARDRAAWALAALDGATVVFGVGVSARSPRAYDEVFSEQSHVLVARARMEAMRDSSIGDVWRDVCGSGPLREPGFSYARLCRVATPFPTRGPRVVELEAPRPPPWLDPNGADIGPDFSCVLVRSLNTSDPGRHVGVLLREAAASLQRVVDTEVETQSDDESTTRDTYVQTEDSSVGTGVVVGAYLSELWVDTQGLKGPPRTWYARACRARGLRLAGATTQPDPVEYP